VLRVDALHQIEFSWAHSPFDKEPFLYEDIQEALAYDQRGQLVIVVSRLAHYIKVELDRLRFEGVRLYSSTLGE